MVKIDPTPELERWLAAERDDDAEGAEAALAAVFSALPAAVPPLGFAARVAAVSFAGAAPARAEAKGALAMPWARLLLTVALIWVGLAAPFAPALLRWLLGGVDAAAAVAAVPRGIAAAGALLARGVETAVRLLDLAGSLAVPFESPAVAAVLLGMLLVAAAAFRLLHPLIAPQRSWSYVDFHR